MEKSLSWCKQHPWIIGFLALGLHTVGMVFLIDYLQKHCAGYVFSGFYSTNAQRDGQKVQVYIPFYEEDR